MSDALAPLDLVVLRDLLVGERDKTVRRIAGLTRDFDAIVESSAMTNTDDEHDPEGQTIGFERAQVSALLTQATGRLADVDRATERFGDGSYGRCRDCGAHIPVERLRAAPLAETCIGCANAAKRSRRRSGGGHR